MQRKLEAVFNSGPFIHLAEIKCIKALKIFNVMLTTKEVANEVGNRLIPQDVDILILSEISKDFVRIVIDRYGVDLGEASALALAKEKGVNLFFTDDMTARDAAKHLGLEAHGTLAILTRAYKEGIINKNEAITAVRSLKSSSMFITQDLIKWALDRINRFKG